MPRRAGLVWRVHQKVARLAGEKGTQAVNRLEVDPRRLAVIKFGQRNPTEPRSLVYLLNGAYVVFEHERC